MRKFNWRDDVVFESLEGYRAWQQAWGRVSSMVHMLVCLSGALALACLLRGSSGAWIWGFVTQAAVATLLGEVVYRHRSRQMDRYIEQLKRERTELANLVERRSGKFGAYRRDAS